MEELQEGGILLCVARIDCSQNKSWVCELLSQGSNVLGIVGSKLAGKEGAVGVLHRLEAGEKLLVHLPMCTLAGGLLSLNSFDLQDGSALLLAV